MEKKAKRAKKLVFLNAPILTSYGEFRFEKLSLPDARKLVAEFAADGEREIQSAIGHAATAEIMTELLGYQVETNRIEFFQTERDEALIFRLNRRPAEGVVLTREQIEEVGYELGILKKSK